MKYLSRAPSDRLGAYVSETYGSWGMWRTFVRLETGTLPSGARAYLSANSQTADKWKGAGHQNQSQFNFKVVQPIGQGSLTGWINGSKRRENDYQDMSLEMIKRLGRDFDNVSDNYQLAVLLAEIGDNRGETGVKPAHPELGTGR